MGEMRIPEDWDAALKCACQSVYWSLQVGMSLPEIVAWFYDDATVPRSNDWDDCVLRARWDTYTWRGVFEMWDECGRPECDPSGWGWDERDPDSRRSAQGNARLDAIGEMVFDVFPKAIEWVARELGWSVVAASDLGDELPEGALLMSSSGWEWEQGSPYATVLIPPASVSAA
jgi:hypothetical protein